MNETFKKVGEFKSVIRTNFLKKIHLKSSPNSV